MLYNESVHYLYSLGNEVQTAKLGLERITALLDALGNPHRAFRSIHLAGTNGKGSTSAMIEVGLRAASIRTGLYTSPHLNEPVERIRIAGEPVSQEEFAAAFVRFENGATLILEVSWLLHHKTTGEDMQMWLYGDKAGANWPSNEILWSNNASQQQLNTTLVRSETGEPHAKECMAFAEAIVTGKPSPVPAEQSLIVMTILDGLYRSAAEGREIRFD